MMPLPESLTKSWKPVDLTPAFRVVPYSDEKQQETRERITNSLGQEPQRIWHLKRMLWHPELFWDVTMVLFPLGDDQYRSVPCKQRHGVLTGYDGYTFEVLLRENYERVYYDGMEAFLADGWILD